MKNSLFGLGFAFIVVAACSSASTSATGTVGGASLNAQDAVFANLQTPSTSGTVLAVTSFTGACDDVTNSRLPKSSAVLSIQMVSNGGTVTAPGTFSFPNATGANFLGASFAAYDATCTATRTDATSGSVSVTAVSASQMTGTFELTFGNDHLSGSFNASYCATLGQGNGSPACI